LAFGFWRLGISVFAEVINLRHFGWAFPRHFARYFASLFSQLRYRELRHTIKNPLKTVFSTMRISIVQMCSSSRPSDNLAHAEAMFEQAASQSSELLVFPENMFAMGARFAALCETDWQLLIDALCSLASKYGLHCVPGTIPLADKTTLPKRLASSLFIDSGGSVKHCYNKIHLFDADVGDEKGGYRESKHYSPGHEPVLVEVDQARIGMAVCFDLRFPNLFQTYKTLGANIILLPSAFTALTGKKHWEILLRARAIETQCFIVAPNQVGRHDDGRETWGHSMVVSPDGEVLLDMDKSQSVATIDLDLNAVQAIRQAMPLNPTHQY